MDWKCYKQRCDTPKMWSRWMLNETIAFSVRGLEKRLQKRHSRRATTKAQDDAVAESLEAVRRMTR